jgi:predicted GH43/DUF377 family glycosyl hydrolase
MWYVGGKAGVTAIGYAASIDGISWTKYATPVLTQGPSDAWDSSQVGLGSVLQINATFFLMWYQGSNLVSYTNGAVGLATSPNGINWTKYYGNPVLRPTSVDQNDLASPYVIRLNDTFNMWYTGKSAADSSQITKILYASSFDGINWFKWPQAVLSPSATKSWDSGSVYSPSVIYDGTNFGIWYTAVNQTYLNPRIGFATGPDGATWTRSPTNPILDLGSPGTWDSSGVEQPSAVIGYGFMLYYDGFSNAGGEIGLARAPQGFSIPEFSQPSVILLLGITTCTAISFIIGKKRHN